MFDLVASHVAKSKKSETVQQALTFYLSSPNEWKGHTSCYSEQEKYSAEFSHKKHGNKNSRGKQGGNHKQSNQADSSQVESPNNEKKKGSSNKKEKKTPEMMKRKRSESVSEQESKASEIPEGASKKARVEQPHDAALSSVSTASETAAHQPLFSRKRYARAIRLSVKQGGANSKPLGQVKNDVVEELLQVRRRSLCS